MPASNGSPASHRVPVATIDGPMRLKRAFLRACALDVLVRKPGNVSLVSAGHRMDAGLFLASALAAVEPLCMPAARVGQRVENAMRATWHAAGCNTNLGILLLCAPIACGFELARPPVTRESLRASITQVLAGLDLADTQAAYRAIAQANPGGLGAAPDQDVHDDPGVDLRSAMALAADRDSIARQYRDGYPLVFDLGLAALGAVRSVHAADSAGSGRAGAQCGGPWRGWSDAPPEGEDARATFQAPPDPGTAGGVQRAYLSLLSAVPDSHIVRKHGAAVAQVVMGQARPWAERALRGEPLDLDPAYAAWDLALKAQGINPGTTADLTVASLMAALLTTSP